MDAPPIQYARSEDGVNIAYWTLGEGPPLLILNPPALAHLDREWAVSAMREWYELLAREYRIVRLNLRGTGLSPHEGATIELADYLRDVDAVIETLDTDRVPLLAVGASAAVAVACAAHHPARVSKLILFETFLGLMGAEAPPGAEASAVVARLGLTVWRRTVAKWNNPSGADPDGSLARLIAEVATPESIQPTIDAWRALNWIEELTTVQAPTLVVERRRNRDGSVHRALRTALIPDGRIRTVEGTAIAPYFEGASEIAREILDFLGEPSGDGVT